MRYVGSYFPNQGLNLCPLPWKCRVLTVGPAGESSDKILIQELMTKGGTYIVSFPTQGSNPGLPRCRRILY